MSTYEEDVTRRKAEVDAEIAGRRGSLSYVTLREECPTCGAKLEEPCVYRSVLGTVVVEPFFHDKRKPLTPTAYDSHVARQVERQDRIRFGNAATSYEGYGFAGDWIFAVSRYRAGFTPAGGGWRRCGSDHGG